MNQPLNYIVSIFTLIFVAACSGTDTDTNQSKSEIPNIKETTIQIENGKISNGINVITLQQYDQVKLLFNSNEEIEIHLHGYDIKKLLKPNQASIMEFKAIATGRYNVTAHTSAHSGHSGHGELFESNTLLPGDSYSYKIPDDFLEKSIMYHDHMEHQTVAMIEVSDKNQYIDEITILITENETTQTLVFDPNVVYATPGMEITWQNELNRKSRITSGSPPNDSKTSENHSDETKLFRIEVYP